MLRVDTEWSGVPGTPYYTSLHFLGSTEEEASAAHAAVVALWDAVDTRWRHDLVATVLPEVSVVDEASGDTTATFLETAVPRPGGTNGARQPLVCQGLVRLRTGTYVGGREIRGKVFMPGTLDQDDTDGIPSTSYRTSLDAGFGALVSSAAGLGIPLVVYSPTNGQAGVVTGVSTWNQWAILRSRRD